MGGPRVPEWVESLIIKVWLQSKKKGDELTGKEVRTSARKSLDDCDRQDVELPKLRKVQAIIAKARKDKEASGEDLNRPWDIGASVKHNIPFEALPALMRVWKLNLMTNYIDLSIRVAQWVARLHTIIPGTSDLMMWAYAYAIREEVCAIMGKSLDTSDLDPYLVMSSWELTTAIDVGMIKPVPLKEPLEEIPFETWFPIGHLEFSDPAAESAAGMQEVDFIGNLDALQAALPRLEEISLGEEETCAYAYWLSYLNKGPKVLPMEKRLDIISRLREWVKSNSQAGERVAEPVKPLELLREVGYEV